MNDQPIDEEPVPIELDVQMPVISKDKPPAEPIYYEETNYYLFFDLDNKYYG